ncbi:MAG: chromate efflux transporter [Planctomycetes bacterium]|nr:chromate efflux transporter [Planctomycetota bacterium]
MSNADKAGRCIAAWSARRRAHASTNSRVCTIANGKWLGRRWRRHIATRTLPRVSATPPPSTTSPAATVPFREALRFWAWLGCVSFGGPAAQIATMHEELVVRRRWLPAERFDHALNFCMLLPGPEAQQLATYSGWLLHGARGGLAAGVLFVLPAAVLLFLLAWIHALWGTTTAVVGILWGCKAVVMALVLEAVLRVGKRALRRPHHAAIAMAALVALLLHVPFPFVVLGGALAGLVLPGTNAAPLGPAPKLATGLAARTLRVAALGFALWAVPLGLLWLGGPSTALARDQYLFFSGAALVTFGGAYAVLAYVLQAAVASYGWITAAQAIDGLALAETTPGPLIMVLQFVGFATGWNHPGTWTPLASASLGAAVTTWATFLPSMLFVFVGAPWVEALRHVRAAQRALAGVTAAVLGVLVNLALVFGEAVLWPTQADGARSFDVASFALAALAFAALATKKLGVLATVAIGGAIGLVRALAA